MSIATLVQRHLDAEDPRDENGLTPEDYLRAARAAAVHERDRAAAARGVR